MRIPKHFATVERRVGGNDSYETRIIHIPPAPHDIDDNQPLYIRIDDVPQDTIIRDSPDAAARAVATMLDLSRQDYQNQLGFSVKYLAD